MNILDSYHLTYCTNIHPGETWQEVFDSLKTYALPLKERLSDQQPMGIGLRLSDRASRDLIQPYTLDAFQAWLKEHDMYVFTMNGFPFGGFHRQRVKDDVHKPDWTTEERYIYTIRLVEILKAIIPDGIEGGISTSPLSYKHWHGSEVEREKVIEQSVSQLAKVASHMHDIHQATGMFLHLDIEPEPDGMIENTAEVLSFYQDYLIPLGVTWLKKEKGINTSEAEKILRNHIQLCYDICHFAVAYEEPLLVFEAIQNADIKIGKIQISAALKAALPDDSGRRKSIEDEFRVFNESTYLHQVIARDKHEKLIQYPDLPEALPHIYEPGIKEWRSHFHVPLFIQQYHHLFSTQDEISKVLDILKTNKITNHLEVETYTWEVLPEALRVDLITSIERELSWVIDQFSS